MVPHTQNQVDPTSYGTLIAEATGAVEHASAVGLGPFEHAQLAADVAIDFERFLAIGGRHLALLAAPARGGRRDLREEHRDLARRLAGLTMERRGHNPWATAGDRLGLAHDVLSTHVSPRGLLRTPEAEVLIRPGVQAAAFARVLSMVSGPLAATNQILTHARSVQPRAEAPLTRGQAAHLRQQARAAERMTATAPPIPLSTNDHLRLLDRLTPTVTKDSAGGTTALDALRVLRQLAFRQSQGAERANAHTLADLCDLGAVACRAARAQLPLAHTSLDRVNRSTSLDRLATAEATWIDLRRQLVPRVQGLSRAPGIYRDAILTLAHDTRRHPAVTQAVLAALPRLAADAAHTVVELRLHGELVVASRPLGQLSQRWQPLSRDGAQALTDGFARAGRATRAAYDAWSDVVRAPTVDPRPTDAPATARHLGLGATS